MSLRRAHLISLGLTMASFAIALALYSRLPDPVPTHWNLRGQVNGWTPKPWGAYALPLTQLGTLLFLILAPRLSPRGFSVARFGRAYAKIEVALMLFFTLMIAVGHGDAAGLHIVSMPHFVSVAVGLLFVILGNYFGKLTPNFYMGIRTPWTLASPEVWSRTHRLGGWLFVAGGLILAVSGLFHPSFVLFVIVLVTILVIPLVYSVVIYRTLDRNDHEDDKDSPE